MADWNHTDSEALYNVPSWGRGFFRVNSRGHVEVLPDGLDREPAIDLHDLIENLRRRGLATPLLLRFDGILRARVRAMREAFDQARGEAEYAGAYYPVYPIKVNQDRYVVDALLEEGRKLGMGLEVGSKPELIAVMTLRSSDERIVVCNGYKDDEYIELALRARKVGANTIIVIEKFSELERVLTISSGLGIEPVIGVRTKLGSRGSGRWQESGGDRSKFGLTTSDIVRVVERLAQADKVGCLQLLHFHIGSQITNIRALKRAMQESAQTLRGLREMGVRIAYMDVGGGLGIDYDGSRTDFESSMNYSLQEYANSVVWSLKETCERFDLDPPAILTESGRALVAHHAVLVTDVLGVSGHETNGGFQQRFEGDSELISEALELSERVTVKNAQECFHDARELRDQAMLLFEVGQLSLIDRARVEEAYWRTCRKIQALTADLDYVPDDMATLERDLADTYFLNFSLFQSLPDSWAIHQLFPVLPIHRLTERPTRRATLADITCDSDGKIDRFIDLRDVKRTLELHAVKEGEPYYLGFFLVGAYQEILGDLHNLFGDTNIVHVDVDSEGRPRLRHVVRGDRVEDVLEYVDYSAKSLVRELRARVEEALDEGKLTYEESAQLVEHFERSLQGYTYLSGQRRAEDVAAPIAERST
jgi:arginine decarboxylase